MSRDSNSSILTMLSPNPYNEAFVVSSCSRGRPADPSKDDKDVPKIPNLSFLRCQYKSFFSLTSFPAVLDSNAFTVLKTMKGDVHHNAFQITSVPSSIEYSYFRTTQRLDAFSEWIKTFCATIKADLNTLKPIATASLDRRYPYEKNPKMNRKRQVLM